MDWWFLYMYPLVYWQEEPPPKKKEVDAPVPEARDQESLIAEQVDAYGEAEGPRRMFDKGPGSQE
jgi:hypothetical protein